MVLQTNRGRAREKSKNGLPCQTHWTPTPSEDHRHFHGPRTITRSMGASVESNMQTHNMKPPNLSLSEDHGDLHWSWSSTRSLVVVVVQFPRFINTKSRPRPTLPSVVSFTFREDGCGQQVCIFKSVLFWSFYILLDF